MFQKSNLYLLLIVFFVIQSFNANASHIMGGEITWNCKSNGKYEFTLKVYRDCNGVYLNTSNVTLYANNYPALGGKKPIPMTFTSVTDISPTCLGSPCTGSSLSPAIPGTIQEFIFRSGDVKLIGTPPAAGWIFTWADGNRNGAINNIKNAASVGITLRAKMFPFQGRNAFPCFDSSPDFFQKPSSINCAGEKFVYNHNAYDNELDSLSYSWAYPLNRLANGATFKTGVTPNILQYDTANGYDYNNPFPDTSQDSRNMSASLNPSNGEISLTSFTGGQYVSVVNVKAYRCGFLVAEVFRELQTVLLLGCAANEPPEIPPPFSNGTFSDTVNAGDFVDLNFSIYDTIRPDNPANDSIFIYATGQQFGNNFSDSTAGCKFPPCATLSHPLPDTAIGSYSARFKWQTSCNHIADFVPDCITSRNTYLFVVKAFDNACPGTGTTMATFSITVVADSLMDHPEIYCADVQNDGSVILNWEKTADPDSSFHQWMIYSANDKNGPYQLIDSVLTYDTTTYTDLNATANDNSMSYLVRVKSGCNSNWLVRPPDTISTIYVEPTFNDSCVFVSWNPLKDSLPTGSETHYKIYREYPIGSGFVFYKNLSTNFTSFCDTFAVCTDTVAYRIELKNTTMGCSSNSNSKGIRFKYPISQADAGSDQDICVGQSVVIGATALHPKDTFIWSPNLFINDSSLIQPTVNPVDTTKYYLLEKDRRGCTSIDSVWVNVRPTPIADAGISDTLVCSQSLPFQLSGTVSVTDSGRWIGGSGTFSPNRNTLNATYMPSQIEINTDSVNLWLVSADNGICDPDTDKIVIHIAQFKANLQLNTTMVSCYRSKDGTAKIITNGSNSPYNFSWQTPSGILSGDTISQLDTGKYTVTITNVLGCDSTMSFVITEPLRLNVNASASNNVSCNGANDAKAYADVNGGTSPYRYSWSNSQKSDTIRNLGPGNYIITITDTNNCTAVDSIKITSPDSLIASIDTSSNISCFGASDGKITAIAKGGTTPYTYSWSNSANTASISGLIPGKYTISITDTKGCLSVDSVTLRQPLALTINRISKRDISCLGYTDGNASVIAQGGTQPYSYLWSNSKTTDSISKLSMGTYYVTITDSNACFIIDSVHISQIPSIQTTLNGNPISCYGRADGEIEATVYGGTSPYQFHWSNNINQNKIIGLNKGNYTVTITDINGCKDTSNYLITEPDSLILTVSPVSDTVCVNVPVQMQAFAQGGTGGYVFNWSHNLGSNPIQNVNITKDEIYTVTLTDSNNCPQKTKTIKLTVQDLFSDKLAVSAKPAAICIGDSSTIQTSFNGKFDPYNYTWNKFVGGIEDHKVGPVSNTLYILTISDICNNSISDSVMVNVSPLPQINLADTLIEGCEDLLVHFSNQTSPSYTYDWKFGDGKSSTKAEPSHLYTKPGLYQVKVSVKSNQGCKNTSNTTHEVKVNPSPTADIFADPTTTTTESPSINFYGDFTDANSWNWNLGQGTDTNSVNHFNIVYPDSGTYYVRLIERNSFGCMDTAYTTIRINPSFVVKIPNAFTPNKNGSNGGRYNGNDYSNEVFHPFLKNVEKYNLLIFNRWGETIFESKDVNIGWDGYYKGQLSQSDVYIYKLSVTFINGKKVTKVGDITLLR